MAKTKTKAKTKTNGYVPRMKATYETELRPRLQGELELSSPMQVPRLTKITLNMGVGEAKTDAKQMDSALDELSTIAGQRAQIRRARKSVASFKLREGMPVGLAVTLRNERAYEFLDRLLSVAIPRIRDFRGLKANAFDGRGNYTLGIREQTIFPEIDYDAIDQVRGLDVVIVTTAQSDIEAFALLESFGMPFSKENRPDKAEQAARAAAAEEAAHHEELRAKAEAEQAALEQLKEENPEAYEKPAEEPVAETEEEAD